MNTVIGSVWWAHNIVGKEMKGREGRQAVVVLMMVVHHQRGASHSIHNRESSQSVSPSRPTKSVDDGGVSSKRRHLKQAAGRQAMHLHVHSHRCVVASRYIHIGIQ